MPERVALLAEQFADDDPFFASARFFGHIQFGSRPPAKEVFDVSVGEALEWARERAAVVLIRLCDGDYFSAGARNPDPEFYPDWPEGGIDVRPRRRRGFEALDNTEADPPVLWDIRLTLDVAMDQALFRAAVEADPRALPIPGDPGDEAGSEVRFLVRASTQQQALDVAKELLSLGDDAGDQRLRSASRAGGGWWKRGPQVYPWAPDARVVLGGSARVSGRQNTDTDAEAD